MSDVDLPRGIALAWGIAADPRRGPKRELSVEKIVDAAMEIADEEGLGSVSMSGIATRLGYTTMSLYRYVSAKDDLSVLMNDEGLGVPPDHDEVDENWRAGLSGWAHALNATYRRHPWLLDLPVDGVPITPNNLAWLDWGLRILQPAEMSAADAVAAVLMISGLVRWQSTIARASASGDQDEAERYVFAELVSADHYPALAAALAAGGMSDGETDDLFAFALARALDGLQHAAASAGSSAVSAGEDGSDDPDPSELADVPRDARLKEATRARREAEARVREAEGKLRDARRRERELIARAHERLAAERARGSS